MSATTANKSILSAKYSKGDKIQSFWNKDYISALFGSGKAAVAAWVLLMQGAVYCPCFYNETLESKKLNILLPVFVLICNWYSPCLTRFVYWQTPSLLWQARVDKWKIIYKYLKEGRYRLNETKVD